MPIKWNILSGHFIKLLFSVYNQDRMLLAGGTNNLTSSDLDREASIVYETEGPEGGSSASLGALCCQCGPSGQYSISAQVVRLTHIWYILNLFTMILTLSLFCLPGRLSSVVNRDLISLSVWHMVIIQYVLIKPLRKFSKKRTM